MHQTDDRRPALSLADKVAFLTRPESYPDAPSAIEAIETHLSWVFLTSHHAYKMKKPVRYGLIDFSTLEARRHNAAEELRLNRRLAPDVYLGVVPLTLADARLGLDGGGEVVEWLVKMRRLPRHCLLDQVIRDRTPTSAEIRSVAEVLARFYASADAIPMDPDVYRQRFAADIAATEIELTSCPHGLPLPKIRHVHELQRAFLDRRGALLRDRVNARRIVEGHGDLRPEHVCLAARPLIIDSLEFNRELRLLDPIDELGYLAMECRQLGAPGVEPVLFETYEALALDATSRDLRRFYQSFRATLRAKIMLWHLRDADVRDPDIWPRRARRYLDLAETFLTDFD